MPSRPPSRISQLLASLLRDPAAAELAGFVALHRAELALWLSQAAGPVRRRSRKDGDSCDRLPAPPATEPEVDDLAQELVRALTAALAAHPTDDRAALAEARRDFARSRYVSQTWRARAADLPEWLTTGDPPPSAAGQPRFARRRRGPSPVTTLQPPARRAGVEVSQGSEAWRAEMVKRYGPPNPATSRPVTLVGRDGSKAVAGGGRRRHSSRRRSPRPAPPPAPLRDAA